MSMQEIVNVIITRQASTITQAGFGTGLILGTHLKTLARLAYYNDLTALALVHPSTSEEYKAAAAYFAQSPAPTRVAVGKRQVNVANVSVAVVANTTLYRVTLNGTNVDITSDGSATATEIKDAMVTAINSALGATFTAASVDTDTLSVTVDTSGQAWSLAVSTNLTVDALTAADTIANDLAAINTEQPDWYGLVLTDRASASMQAAALWVEANKKFLFASSQEANIADQSVGADSTTLAALLKAAGYERSPVFYSAAANTNYIDAAAMGRILALEPGSYTAMFRPLTSITVSSLTSTQSTNVRAKKANAYENIGGQNMVWEGTVPMGEYIDTIIGIDWLEARMEERVFAKMAALLKVPFTDAGIGIIEAEVKAQLQQGIDRSLLSSYTVTVPKAAAVSSVDKQARTLPDVKFTAILAGAIHKTTINGVVSV